jgi:hypothetical protein
MILVETKHIYGEELSQLLHPFYQLQLQNKMKEGGGGQEMELTKRCFCIHVPAYIAVCACFI